MDKAPDAFRTISEVAEDLDVPQHVLRFWETRFAQIRPMKRSGGRRFYRPDDIYLLRGIRRLLYGEGYTIRGVQKILKEHGVKAVQAFADGSPLAPLKSEKTEPVRRDSLEQAGHDVARAAAPREDESGTEPDHDFDIADDDDAINDDDEADVAEAAPSETQPVAPQRSSEAGPASRAAAAGQHRQSASDNSAAQHELQLATPDPALDAEARSRLKAALDELVACRELIDQALKDHPGAPIPEI